MSPLGKRSVRFPVFVLYSLLIGYVPSSFSFGDDDTHSGTQEQGQRPKITVEDYLGRMNQKTDLDKRWNVAQKVLNKFKVELIQEALQKMDWGEAHTLLSAYFDALKTADEDASKLRHWAYTDNTYAELKKVSQFLVQKKITEDKAGMISFLSRVFGLRPEHALIFENKINKDDETAGEALANLTGKFFDDDATIQKKNLEAILAAIDDKMKKKPDNSFLKRLQWGAKLALGRKAELPEEAQAFTKAFTTRLEIAKKNNNAFKSWVLGANDPQLNPEDRNEYRRLLYEKFDDESTADKIAYDFTHGKEGWAVKVARAFARDGQYLTLQAKNLNYTGKKPIQVLNLGTTEAQAKAALAAYIAGTGVLTALDAEGNRKETEIDPKTDGRMQLFAIGDPTKAEVPEGAIHLYAKKATNKDYPHGFLYTHEKDDTPNDFAEVPPARKTALASVKPTAAAPK